jgi:hypothetical protein
VGQSYIIELERDFMKGIVKTAKNEKIFDGKVNTKTYKTQKVDKEADRTDIETEGKNYNNSKHSTITPS